MHSTSGQAPSRKASGLGLRRHSVLWAALIGCVVAGSIVATSQNADAQQRRRRRVPSTQPAPAIRRGADAPAEAKVQPQPRRAVTQRRTAQPSTRRRRAPVGGNAQRVVPRPAVPIPPPRRVPGGALVLPARPTPTASHHAGGVLPGSEEADNWLRRAEEGIESSDWKLAVDALQRLVEIGGDVVTTADQQVYYSARRHAHRLIAELDDAGRRTYRLMHDPDAKRLFDRGVAEHDEAALREVVSRFFVSSYGDDASDVLAAWWLDEGRASEAISVLADLLDVYPDADVPEWAVRGKLALAEAMLGDTLAARQALAGLPHDSTLAEDTRQRLQSIASLVDRLAPEPFADAATGWRMLMGDTRRTGRMPAVTDTALRSTPLTLRLPTQRMNDGADYGPRVPAWSVVADGDQVVIKTDSRLIALDAISLDVLWESTPLGRRNDETAQNTVTFQQGMVVGVGGRVVVGRPPQPGTGRQLTRPPVDGESVGSVSLAHGLAFVIDHLGQPLAGADDAFVVRGQGAIVFRGGVVPRTSRHNSPNSGTQLLAFDLGLTDDGAAATHNAHETRPVDRRQPRWTRGGLSESSESLQGATFLAPPIAVGRQLLLPFHRNSDVYAGILDPTDGRLLDEVFLCGTADGWVDARLVQHPAAADQTAYVPTGLGLLAAVNTSDHSLRWVSRYPRSESHSTPVTNAFNRRTTQVPALADSRWLSCPPTIAGRLVLLAPTDADRLFAFDRQTGRIVWHVQRGKHQFIVGITRVSGSADTNRRRPETASRDVVILGGPRVTALDLNDGQVVWSVSIGPITGRGALVAGTEGASDRVLIPTGRWLVQLDADNGSVLDRIEVAGGETDDLAATNGAGHEIPNRLGNLLCWGGSLFSLEWQRIREFPDVARAYEVTRALHLDDPDDPVTRMRMASLELLRDDPRAAVSMLRELPDRHALDDVRRLRLSRIEVRALLALARAPGVERDEIEAVLHEAFARAQIADDWMESGLALASHLADAARRVEAMNQYAALALGPFSRELLRLPGDRTRSRAGSHIDGLTWCRGWRIVADRMAPLRDALRDDEAETVRQALTARLAAADATTWRVLADAELLPEIAQQIGLLRAANRGRSNPTKIGVDLAAEPLARLAVVYLGGQDLTESGMACLEELTHEWSGARLPAALANGAGAPQDADENSRVPVADFVAHWSAQIPDDQRGRAASSDEPLEAAPTVELIGGIPNAHAWPIRIRGTRPPGLAGKALFLADDRGNRAIPRFSEPAPATVLCHNLADLTLEWPAELVFDFDPVIGRATQADESVLFTAQNRQLLEAAGQPTPISGAPAHAVAAGQVLVITSSRGVHAIGLKSGIRLWARTASADAVTTPGSDQAIALAPPEGPQAGRLAMVLDPSVVELVDVATGQALWRHELPGGDLAAVRIAGDYVVALSRGAGSALVFAMADGRFLHAVAFKHEVVAGQGGRREPPPLPLVFDHAVCGPNESDVVAYDIATGREIWRVGAKAPVVNLFKPRDDLVGAATADNRLLVVEPARGDVWFQGQVSGIQGPIQDAVLHDDVLVALARPEQIEPTRPFAAKLVGLAWDRRDNDAGRQSDIIAGDRRWDLTLPDGMDAAQLRAAANAFPIIEYIQPEGGGLGARLARTVRVSLFDKATGRRVGHGAQVPVSEDVAVDGAIEVLPGYVVVGGRYGAVVFRTTDGVEGQEKKSSRPPPGVL